MRLLRGVQHLRDFDKGVVATIGNFDGVHLGHQSLIHSLKLKAMSMNLPLVVILFEPQPQEYFQKEKAPSRLSSLREKLDMLRLCKVDFIYCIKFDDKMAQTSAKEFVSTYLFSMLQVKYLLVGEDFRFGKNREGDLSMLRILGSQYGCDVRVFPDFLIKSQRVSSTKIRMALQIGNFDLAAKYLGRPFSLCGRVISGDGRGRQWGIPTANLSLHRLTFPLQGVFVVEAQIGSKRVQGVANVGRRPTIDGTKNILEVHLFNFNDSIYGELMQVFFLHKLRDEVKFTSVDALIAQINKDIVAAKTFFEQNIVIESI